MSFRFPDFNSGKAGNLAVRANLGTACTKNANRASVTLFWLRTRDMLFDANANHLLLARNGGATSGSDAYVRLANDASNIQLNFRNSSATLVSAAVPTTLRKTYLVIVAARNGYVHLIACEPGGTPIVSSVVNTTLYSTAFTTGGTKEMWTSIGSAPSSTPVPFYGAMEEFNFYLGAFPETSAGVPDAALIQAIADGVQDLNTLHTLLGDTVPGTAAQHRVRYRMRDPFDLADAKTDTSNAAAADMTLTIPAAATAAAQRVFTSGPLRPVALMPALTRDCISQVMFAVPGDAATATADIRVEGGSYAGLPTMGRVQARLMDEADSELRGWIDLPTAAPSSGAGTWAASAGFLAVPMTASYLRVEFRALDGGGAVIAGPVPGYGLRGAGFHEVCTAQSQLMTILEGTGAVNLTPGARGIFMIQKDGGFLQEWALLSSGDTAARALARGGKQWINEINARFPGVPVQIDTHGQSGTGIGLHIPASAANVNEQAGVHAGRPALLRANWGVDQPFFMMFMGHSEGAASNYGLLHGELVAHSVAGLGPRLKNLHAPTPRYLQGGTDEDAGGNANQVHWARRGIRQYCLDNPGDNIWMGSWSMIAAGNEPTPTGNGSHPPSTNEGQGRSGALLAWGQMSAARAVADLPLGIVAVRAEGADAVLEFGPVNA